MRPKVLHIITLLEFGGAQQNTLYTASHLDPERFEASVLTGGGGTLDPDAAALPVRVRTVEDLVREVHPVRDLGAFFELWSLIRAERPDVVHTHSSKAGILGRFAAALAGVPLIVHTFHGFGFHERMRPLTRRFYVLLERAAARITTRLVFVSKANMATAELCGIGEPSRYVLIRSGVRLADFPAPAADRAAKRASLGLPPDAPMVLGVGNLKPQKNALDFVRVAAAVRESVPEARFVFVGDGELRGRMLAEIEARGLQDRVRLLGWRKDVGELLASADAFLLTSLWEGLPRALVEAMKSGLPCACYAVDGVTDLLRDGENGFAAPAGDWRRLARDVAGLLEDGALRKKLGRKAAESIGEEFDIDFMVRRQETLYEELLTQAAGPARSPAR